MSTVRFIESNKSEKNLASTTVYKYYPDVELKDKILADVIDHAKENVDCENDVIELKIEVIIKKYDRAGKFYYDEKIKPTNDTTPA